MSINALLEYARWTGVGLGFFLANYYGETGAERYGILCIWVVLSLAGLTGLESVFFGKGGAERSGYGDAGPYQRQSGLNNLALALTTIIIYLFGWGVWAKLTVMTVLLSFLTLSAANHTLSAVKDKNLKPQNLLRPILTAALLAATIPYMILALP